MESVLPTQAVNKIHENSHGGWECPCGNDPTSYGFFPINDQNEEVEPAPDEWTTNLYACFKCGRLIDATTLEIVNQVLPNEIKRSE
jgi:hypothetical protein